MAPRREKVDGRAAELIEYELSLRDLRKAMDRNEVEEEPAYCECFPFKKSPTGGSPGASQRISARRVEPDQHRSIGMQRRESAIKGRQDRTVVLCERGEIGVGDLALTDYSAPGNLRIVDIIREETMPWVCGDHFKDVRRFARLGHRPGTHQHT